MAFPPAFLDELVARNPIEDVVGQYVSLKRSGGNLFGLCPFHGEKTASFSVAPTKESITASAVTRAAALSISRWRSRA